ncbi:3-dehydroquinate synthase [Candidatus Roizmanbacteria bacterium]|nr:MAG: 3-dehydroquinate synthase [Candidatus Roizmanbacteria bacterium]
MNRTLTVSSTSGSYPVTFVDDLRDGLKKTGQKNAHLLLDSHIGKMYKKIDSTAFLSVYEFDARESNKNLTEVQNYAQFLIKNGIKKSHQVVVIGGGLIQDIGSFTAHILLRGINWVFIPTTLLSVADSCIGSKSGINVGAYKNQVGAFHPPKEIYIYHGFLKTLPAQEIQNGIGEILKHALIKGGSSYQSITENLSHIQQDKVKGEQVIYESLLIKKEIVEEDEFEKDIRRLLNYGHSFGHALEGYTKNKIPHGIGVSIGMDIANFVSMKRKLITQEQFDEISRVLRTYIPYDQIQIDDIDLYLKFLSRDKKIIGDKLYAILCEGIGTIKITPIKIDKELGDQITEYCQSFKR